MKNSRLWKSSLSALFVMSLVGCDVLLDEKEVAIAENEKVSISIPFEKNSSFAQVAKTASVKVYRKDETLLSATELTIDEQSVYGKVANIPVGTGYSFILEVFDGSSTLVYRGEATADITANTTTEVAITLNPVVGSAVIIGTIIENDTTVVDTLRDSQLVAHFLLDGTGEDITGNGFNGFVYGASPTEDRFGNPKAALYFDGKNDKVMVPFHPSINTETFTISLWGNAKDNDRQYRSAIAARTIEPEFMGFCLYANPENIWQPHIGYGSGWYKTLSSAVDNKWVHYVMTYDGEILSYYINGELESSRVLNYVPNRSEDLLIGAGEHYGAEDFYWHGALDDVRIYNYAISSENVQELFLADE